MTINLKDVHVVYPGMPNKPILNIQSWVVGPQEQVFVHGPSGCRKSTLLNLLSGMLVPKNGEVSILNDRLDQMDQRQRDRFRANHIGYVFQQFNLIPYLNAVESVQLATHFGKHATSGVRQNEIEALLEKLNISSDDWHKQASTLSIGQQQRVAIARALINKPTLLIADEPTSSLDQDNRDNFMSVLMSLVAENNITLVFVSHDLSLSRYFNRVDALSDISSLDGDG
ncbi:ABC transporter ATP-binding protein [Candidatus Endobugula sertula]|uniref:ABC transporter ATP-binding protein n=1 Tax=Candidatus Endobugula sertula TaxID=62101 RepID=A0A1D2QRP5_9GAMM|nr:ABC transporter ATP-binding protein [Candidatus Endobugula sertula]